METKLRFVKNKLIFEEKKGQRKQKEHITKKKKKRDETQRKCLVNYVELKIRTM